jgi:hypothetical protein
VSRSEKTKELDSFQLKALAEEELEEAHNIIMQYIPGILLTSIWVRNVGISSSGNTGEKYKILSYEQYESIMGTYSTSFPSFVIFLFGKSIANLRSGMRFAYSTAGDLPSYNNSFLYKETFLEQLKAELILAVSMKELEAQYRSVCVRCANKEMELSKQKLSNLSKEMNK